jgi:hypothetical protein
MFKHAIRPSVPLPACILVAVTAGCSIDDLLDVDVPGRVPESALNDPALAQTLVNSVIGDLECAWTNYTAAAAVQSDEYLAASGNLANKQWASRQITETDNTLGFGACGFYGSFTPLHTARFQAEDIYARLESFGASVPNKVRFQATVRAYGAYALLALGEGYCEMTIDGGPIMTPDEVLRLSEARFTEAIQLATEANVPDILNLARVGRARVRLDLEDFAGARADAELVPAGYLKVASRDASSNRRWNVHHELVNGPNGRHASVADNYRELEFKGVPDPRVEVMTLGELSFDFVTIHWFHDKTSDRITPVPLASYKEARLIVAEAAARTGDLETARTILNALHADAGLPAYEVADIPAQNDVIRAVIEERRRELFTEGGWRINDMLRFRGTEFNIPFKGEPGSIHPNGVDQTGQIYGTTTCLPLPSSERLASGTASSD